MIEPTAQSIRPGITTDPFPNSRKVYVEGSRPDIRVPMREIRVAPTRPTPALERCENPPVTVYDTSGPVHRPAARDRPPPGPGAAARARGSRSAATSRSWPAAPRTTAASALADPHLDRAALQPRMRKPLPRQAGRERHARCTTPARASSRPRWNSSPSAKTCAAELSGSEAARPGAATWPSIPGSRCGAAHPAESSRRSSCATRSPAAAPSSRPTSTTRRASR